METSLPLLVFTDLDGTLIDHQTYQWDDATPALRKLQAMNAGVVLASSKTAVEIITLQDELDLRQWPAIAENGECVLLPGKTLAEQQKRYDELLALINRAPARLRALFQGFNEMDTATVAQLTGLSLEAASNAKERMFSEPGLWSGNAIECDEFLQFLRDHGVYASQGGRFLTLSFGQTKADAMTDIISQQQPLFTVALGDAPNDIEMLETADFGVIVFNPFLAPLPTLKGEAEGRIMRTELPGPAGWNVAMLEIIERIESNTLNAHNQNNNMNKELRKEQG